MQVILGAMSSIVRSQTDVEQLESSATNQVPDLPNAINAFAKTQLEKCGLDEPQGMVKTYLTDKSITCNDGSPSGWVQERTRLPIKKKKKVLLWLSIEKGDLQRVGRGKKLQNVWMNDPKKEKKKKFNGLESWKFMLNHSINRNSPSLSLSVSLSSLRPFSLTIYKRFQRYANTFIASERREGKGRFELIF